MAMTPSGITHFQIASPNAPGQPGILLTPASQRRPVRSHQAAPRSAALFALPKEPEDARLTGGTRSLDRRLLALNLCGGRSGGQAA
jgi:hypothetical protein